MKLWTDAGVDGQFSVGWNWIDSDSIVLFNLKMNLNANMYIVEYKCGSDVG
jgi:hypothetical protein